MTGSWRKLWTEMRAATADATLSSACAPTVSGFETTTGAPLSASSRIALSSGMAPR